MLLRKLLLRKNVNLFERILRNAHNSVQIPLLSRFLRLDQKAVVEKEKALLYKVLDILKQSDASTEEINLLQDTQARIEDLFLIVIVGEFNTGKSTLLNSLLGYDFLPSGVLPTTDKICIIRNKPEVEEQDDFKNNKECSKMIKTRHVYFNSQLSDSVEEKYVANVEWLENVCLVDTPGTNSVNLDHDALTKLIVPRADLVYFVTSAERPMSESERTFLTHISQWGKKISIIINKIDILNKQEQNAVFQFVEKIASTILKDLAGNLRIFGISGRLALQAIQITQQNLTTIDPNNQLFQESRIQDLYSHLVSNLKHGDLIASKLKNPLVISEKLLQSITKRIEDRLHVIESDERILEMIEENNSAFIQDIKRDVKSYRMHIDAICAKMSALFDEFLDRNVSIFRPFELMDVNAFVDKFKMQAAQDISRPVESILQDISSLISQRAKSHSKGVLTFMGDRHKRVSGSMVGTLNEAVFDSNREQLFVRVEKDAQRIINDMNPDRQIRKFGQQISTSFSGTLSTLAVSGLLITQVIDITGIIAVSSVALGGLVLVPWRKDYIRKEFKAGVNNLKEKLDGIVTTALEQELTSIMISINSTIDPYARFVRIERAKLGDISMNVTNLKEEIKALKVSIQAM